MRHMITQLFNSETTLSIVNKNEQIKYYESSALLKHKGKYSLPWKRNGFYVPNNIYFSICQPKR